MRVLEQGWEMNDGRWTSPAGEQVDSTDVPSSIKAGVWKVVREAKAAEEAEVARVEAEKFLAARIEAEAARIAAREVDRIEAERIAATKAARVEAARINDERARLGFATNIKPTDALLLENASALQAFILQSYVGVGTFRNYHEDGHVSYHTGRVFRAEGEEQDRNTVSFAGIVNEKFRPEAKLTRCPVTGDLLPYGTDALIHETLRSAGSRAVVEHTRTPRGGDTHAKPQPIEGAADLN